MRKPKKLPAASERIEYQLEYGTDVLEIHLHTRMRARAFGIDHYTVTKVSVAHALTEFE